MYTLGFLLSGSTAGVFYYLFCRVWPVQVYPAMRGTDDMSFEVMGRTDGYLDGDDVVGVEPASSMDDVETVQVWDKL